MIKIFLALLFKKSFHYFFAKKMIFFNYFAFSIKKYFKLYFKRESMKKKNTSSF